MRIDHVTIIGAGGTGQLLIPPLVRLLTYHPNALEPFVEIYDGDSFEDHNAQRQIGSSGEKTTAIEQLLEQQGLRANVINAYMTKARFQRVLNRTPDVRHLVIAAVDNDATRKMCIDELEAFDGNFAFVTPGNSDVSDKENDIKGNVLWFGRNDGQRFGVNPALVFPNIEHPQDAIPRNGGCAEQQASTPQLITSNALAAAYTLAVVQNILDDRMPDQASSCFFNGRSFSLSAN